MARVNNLQAAVHQTLNNEDPFQGLTSQQHRFVTLSLSGLNDTEAYRAVFQPKGMTEAAIQQAAHQMAHRPNVVMKLTEMRKRIDDLSTLAPQEGRNFVMNGLTALAINAQKESVQLGALIALGKTAGIDLFREVRITEHVNRTVEDVESELKRKLLELQQRLTIDASANKPDAPGTDSATPRDRRRKPSPG